MMVKIMKRLYVPGCSVYWLTFRVGVEIEISLSERRLAQLSGIRPTSHSTGRIHGRPVIEPMIEWKVEQLIEENGRGRRSCCRSGHVPHLQERGSRPHHDLTTTVTIFLLT